MADTAIFALASGDPGGSGPCGRRWEQSVCRVPVRCGGWAAMLGRTAPFPLVRGRRASSGLACPGLCFLEASLPVEGVWTPCPRLRWNLVLLLTVGPPHVACPASVCSEGGVYAVPDNAGGSIFAVPCVFSVLHVQRPVMVTVGFGVSNKPSSAGVRQTLPVLTLGSRDWY